MNVRAPYDTVARGTSLAGGQRRIVTLTVDRDIGGQFSPRAHPSQGDTPGPARAVVAVIGGGVGRPGSAEALDGDVGRQGGSMARVVLLGDSVRGLPVRAWGSAVRDRAPPGEG